MLITDKNYSRHNLPKQNMFSTPFVYLSLESAKQLGIDMTVNFFNPNANKK